MKRFFLFILLLLTIYIIKPLWEEPVSQYVDLSFLEPVDEKFDDFLTSSTVTTAVHYVNDATAKVMQTFFPEEQTNNTAVESSQKPGLTKPENSRIAIHNIEIGTTEKVVNEMLGAPKGSSLNEYGTEWVTYHQEYHNFILVSFDDKRKVNAIYTNDDLISSDTGIGYRTDKSIVRETYGTPLTEIRKGFNIYLLQDDTDFDLFEIDNMYAYIFYDVHQNNQVTAIQLVEKSLEQENNKIYATADSQLREGFESQLFDLTNAARVRHGLPYLKWEEQTSQTARNHSLDMAKQNYFNHENKKGQSPFDRMKADGIEFRSAGENLAYGQASSIFAHEGLMNSKGHRDNILLDTYSHLGTGVAFNDKNQPYYTEKFLLK